MTDLGSTNITWTRKLESYFSATGERANCLSWSHTEAEKIFSYRRTFIDLPVIVLSSVTGFLSVGSSTLFSGNPASSSSGLGAVSLFVAVLNTLGTYFSWAKRAEAHRIAAIHYSKLYRFICVEMALPREERTQPAEFLKYTKEQYDRLYEISPPLPDEVIKAFHAKFSAESLKDISLPEQMHGLEAIHVYNECDLENDLNLQVKTKKLEVRHQHNIDKVPIESPTPTPIQLTPRLPGGWNEDWPEKNEKPEKPEVKPEKPEAKPEKKPEIKPEIVKDLREPKPEPQLKEPKEPEVKLDLEMPTLEILKE